jgi:photosystem II stability/assembly factor-like uncharacterized protein
MKVRADSTTGFQWLGVLLVPLLLSVGFAKSAFAEASEPFPALERPAMSVRSPERSVLLGVTLAGERVVAVGERGVVVLSDDGGRTWRQAKSVPTSVTLTALSFIDAKQGWAVGHGGVILQSKDGGETWIRQANGRSLARAALAEAPDDTKQHMAEDPPDKPLLDVHFVDAQLGYVVGAYNLAFETRDGGKTWSSLMQRIENPKGAHLYSVAVRGNSIFIAGEQGALFRSQDQGRTFGPMSGGYAGTWFSILAMGENGLMVAGLKGHAAYSSDDGETWSAVAGAPPITLSTGIRLPNDEAVFVNQAGQILRSHDGTSFAMIAMPTTLPPTSDLLPLPDGGLLAVGIAGALRLPAPQTMPTK